MRRRGSADLERQLPADEEQHDEKGDTPGTDDEVINDPLTKTDVEPPRKSFGSDAASE